MKHKYSVAVIATVLACAGSVWAAPSPAQKCEAGKNATAGKYSLCRQKAEAKLVLKGDTTKYDEAIAKCSTKFINKWLDLEADAEGACPSGPDETALEYLIRSHANVVAWKVSGDSRFVDNADGTISDNQTQLMWEKKVKLDSASDYADLHDADNIHPWAGSCSISGSRCQPTTAAATACAAGVEGNSLGCAECPVGEGTCETAGPTPTVWEWVVSLNTASFAGHTDWRIAKLSELESIRDFSDTIAPPIDVAFHGASCGVACTDITSAGCACTATMYSTATSLAAGATNGWVVTFTTGYITSNSKINRFYNRAVRGGL